MTDNIIVWLFVALGFMSAIVVILAFWNLRLQDENDRLRISNVGQAPPF